MTVLTEVDKWRQRLTLSSKKRWDDYVPSHLKYSLSSYERPNLFLCCRDNLHKSGILVEKDRKQKNNNSNNKKVIGNIEGLPQWLRRWRICLQCGRSGFNPWSGKIHWRRKLQPIPVFLLENSMDRGAWMATVHGVAKNETWLRDWEREIEREYCILR